MLHTPCHKIMKIKMNATKAIKSLQPILLLAVIVFTACAVKKQIPASSAGVFAKNNLIAWCIVPFDVKNRSSEERAQMLMKLGITKLAYDWRPEHVPTFDTELQTMKKYHIKMQAFWLYAGADPEGQGDTKLVIDALARNHVKTDIWLMVDNINMEGMTEQQKVEAHAKPIKYIAEQAAKIGCRVGLYNHNGWYGEPENQLAIIDYLKMPNIGMVYNFHHAENHVDRFPQFYPKILPHLIAITLSGLKGHNPATVVPVGEGDEEYGMMRIINESSYKGPIAIINEDTRPDAEDGLKLNMDGVEKVIKKLGYTDALKTYSN
jgi:hypothetical protein